MRQTTARPRLEAPAAGAVTAAVVLAALGYFVDIYDLILFSIVRVKSLKAIGVPDGELLSTGAMLLKWQMRGMLAGGLLWGILGDKKGRLSVLFGSIALYSVANTLNGFVHSVQAYAWLRLFAGIGLAGELGAGITLVSETMPKETRGYGTMIVAGVGIFGGVVAGLIGDTFDWRTAYFVGGAMGLALLALRVGVYESGLYASMARTSAARGDFSSIFRDRRRALRYICSIAVGLPIWYVLGVLVTFSPEFGKALEMPVRPNPAYAVLWFYVGCALGDFASGAASQYFGSRRKVALAFMAGTGAMAAAFLNARGASLTWFYAICAGMGFAAGYWAVFVTMASEQFGTNIRATVTTTVPNFVRGALDPMLSCFQAAKGAWGLLPAAGAVGVVVLGLALVALSLLDETHGKDLDYLEG
jgi:MFS transporter, putative metabolite:H+ symporter